jgi:hypothetical protein
VRFRDGCSTGRTPASTKPVASEHRAGPGHEEQADGGEQDSFEQDLAGISETSQGSGRSAHAPWSVRLAMAEASVALAGWNYP